MSKQRPLGWAFDYNGNLIQDSVSSDITKKIYLMNKGLIPRDDALIRSYEAAKALRETAFLLDTGRI